MKKSRIAIIGAGKHAMMLKQLIVSQGYRFVGFFDEKKNKNKNKFILGNLTDLSLNTKKIDFVVKLLVYYGILLVLQY